MRKRLSSKLLAVILTIAICATTVLGCLMTVSAADSCYSFSTAVFAEDDLTQATMDVTFTKNETLPNGFSSGAFTLTEVDPDGEDYLTVKGVEAVTKGVELTNEGSYYIFNGEGFDSVTFTITFGFSAGEASNGRTYKVKLTDVELAYNDAEYFVQDNANGAIGEISAGCKHSVTGVGQPIATGVGGQYGYSVYEKSVCTLCGETFDYQLVPTAEELGGDASAKGTTDILEYGSYLTDANSSSQYYDSVVADNGEAGTQDNPIIIDSAEEFVYLCKGDTTNYTKDKYFKVADGIAAFDLSGGKVDLTKSLSDNLTAITTSGKNHSGDTKWSFQGHFDGNGVTVYGAWINGGSYAGLFPCTKGDVTIKNLNVTLSYFKGSAATGGIVGYHAKTNDTQVGSLTIENCSVTDTYLEITGTAWGTGVGAIIGREDNSWSWSEATEGKDGNGDNDMVDTIYENGRWDIKNCYVNLDENYFVSTSASSNVSIRGGVIGWSTTNGDTTNNGANVQNCVVIGITPYGTNQSATDNNVQHVGTNAHFKNVYTDKGSQKAKIGGTIAEQDFTNRIFILTADQLKGSAAVLNMPNLDWGNTWVMDGKNTYPRLALPGEEFDTIYWDGSSTKTAPTVGNGDKDTPFIISTVAELAYVAGQTRDNYAVTDGKYFKIADGIKNIVMQPYAYGNDIMSLSSAAETKAYFEENAASMKQWFHYGWEGSTFCGNIDFNGATVYGIYQVSADNAGLFSNMDAGAVFQNLAIKNSYMVSQSSGKNYQVGAIAAVANGSGYGKNASGIIWAKNVVVANNYMYDNVVSTANNDRAGVLFGAASSDAIYVDNALVYGNDATYGDGAIMPIYSNVSNSVDENAAVPEGLVISYGSKHNTTGLYLHNNMVRNSIILGAKPYDLSQDKGSRFNDPACYENVYTDADIATDKFLNDVVLGATEGQIETVKVADILGAAAETAMSGLTWGTDWYCGAEGNYPVLAAFTEVGVANSSNPDFKIVGTSIVYENDGSFSMNIHYIPAYEGFAPTMYVGDTNCTKLYILDAPVESSKREEIGDNTAMMFTLKGISAKNIDKLWHPTLVAATGAKIDWSQSAQISVADNARAVIAGDYDTADKNVSSAVLLYGDASKAALAIGSSDYNAGTIDLLEFATGGNNLPDSESPYYDTHVADNGESGDSWENAIIIDSAEEFVYLCKGDSKGYTDGKYFKVADGIAGFNLANKNLDINKSLKDNLDAIKGSGKNHAGNTDVAFQGHFDGNGITIYGAWTNHEQVAGYAGLFTCAQGDVTIKNVNVKLSYFVGTTAVGGIVGYYKGEGTATNNTSLTIENCSVADCYLETTGVKAGTAIGAIVGKVECPSGYTDTNDEDKDNNFTETLWVNNNISVKNCFVNLDETYFKSSSVAVDGYDDDSQSEGVIYGGAVAYCGSNALMVSDCIVIGVTPYAVTDDDESNQIQHSGHDNNFSNVYTDQPSGIVKVGGSTTPAGLEKGQQDLSKVVFSLETSQLTGATAKDNMSTLDWNTVWTTTDGYPTFINKDYEAPAYAIYWDGTTATGIAEGSGEKDDPYIINTAAELAYVVSRPIANYADTDGKYFKVADGIKSIVLQPESKAAEIMALGSAAETKAYFENGSGFHTWKIGSWEGTTFCGNIDFNGATVYGAYIKGSTYNAALIGNIDGGAVVSNLTLKNSYLTSVTTGANYQVGAIAAVSNGASYGKKTAGIIWINGVTVANNYLYNNSTSGDRSGVMIGASSDVVYTDNCLVYGNDATYGDGVKMPLYATVGNAVTDTNIPEGLVAKYAGSNENGDLHVAAVRNSIILGCTPYDLTQNSGSRFNDPNNSFENVYTDADLANDTFTNGTLASTFKGLTQVTDLNTLKGAAAQTVVDTFNSANGSTVWYVGATGDYPGHKPAGVLSSNLQAIYDGIVLTPDTYKDTGIDLFSLYATSVNLNSNPYMSFAFEFGGELKENRDQIEVTFTYTVNGTEHTYTTTPPKFEGDGTVNGTNGWYNRPTAGRFHTYRFTEVPVEALANPIKVSATYGGETYELGTVSVAGLAYEFESQNKLTPSDYYTTRIEAVKALLFYTQMIHARYGAQ